MIELALAAYALWVLSDCMVKAHEAFCSFLVTARVEQMAREAKALQYSERHKPILPLLLGMAEELTVTEVGYAREGGKVRVELVLTRWGRFKPGNKARLKAKAKALLEEGGVKEVT